MFRALSEPFVTINLTGEGDPSFRGVHPDKKLLRNLGEGKKGLGLQPLIRVLRDKMLWRVVMVNLALIHEFLYMNNF